MSDISALRLYWPDNTNVTCEDADCAADGDNATITPPGRRISVGELIEAVEEHAREFHPAARSDRMEP